MFLVSLIISIFFIIQFLSLLWILAEEDQGKLLWFFKAKRNHNHSPAQWPKVSILLAARNEEQLILRSLRSLESLEYPSDKLEILIGNDDSSDRTEELTKEFIKNKPNFRLINIKKQLGKGRGKANVLAHLAHEANGEFFFITDVDVAHRSSWIKGMLSQFKPETGIASGISMCERGGLFASMQSMDWLHFMGYIKAFARVGVACTSVGNNMAVRAKAYWETGGYENIDFSITEDYKLFKEVCSRGWKWANELNPETLGLASHITSPSEMLHQRKRWLIGARELPWNWKFLIALYGLFIPALAVLFLVAPEVAAITWFVKLMAQSIFISVLCQKVEVKAFNFFHLLTYEIYVIINTLVTAVFYFLPLPSIWKGRVYNKAYIENKDVS